MSDLPSLEEDRRLDRRAQPRDQREATAHGIPTKVERGKRHARENLWAFPSLATYLVPRSVYRPRSAARAAGRCLRAPHGPTRRPRPPNAPVRSGPASQRIPLRVLDRLDSKIDVQLRPVQVVRMWPLHINELADGPIPEPREILKRQKDLSIAEEEPEAVGRYVGNLNARNGFPTLRGSHAHASESVEGPLIWPGAKEWLGASVRCHTFMRSA